MTLPIDRLIRSERSTIALIVRPDASLEVRAPLEVPDRHIRDFIDKHTDWILAQQERARRNPPPPVRKFADGDMFLFQGRTYPLRILPRQRPALTFTGEQFQLAATALPRAREAFTRWYRAQAAMLIPEQVQKLAARHGFSYQKIRISSARTRWGSCSSKGTLSISWKLIMAPAEILEYVLIHELVHTRIHNHSRQFWSAVISLVPDCKLRRAWLRKNGKTLSLD